MKQNKKRPLLKVKKKALTKANVNPTLNVGWVPLKRELLDSPIIVNSELCRLYVWCLLRANHQKRWVSLKIGKGTTEILVKRGTFIAGRNTGAQALGIPPSTFRNHLVKLEKHGWILIKAHKYYSIIELIDYGITPMLDKLPTSDEQVSNTNNNLNKEKNERD